MFGKWGRAWNKRLNFVVFFFIYTNNERTFVRQCRINTFLPIAWNVNWMTLVVAVGWSAGHSKICIFFFLKSSINCFPFMLLAYFGTNDGNELLCNVLHILLGNQQCCITWFSHNVILHSNIFKCPRNAIETKIINLFAENSVHFIWYLFKLHFIKWNYFEM